MSLRKTFWWLKQHFSVQHAIAFDGGRNFVLVVRSSDEEFQTYGTPKLLPDVFCMLVMH